MYWQRLENLRIDHDLTQQQVADLLNCQREVYRRYEKGTRELPLSYAIILANYYHVSIDYMVNLTDDPTDYKQLAVNLEKALDKLQRLQKYTTLTNSVDKSPTESNKHTNTRIDKTSDK